MRWQVRILPAACNTHKPQRPSAICHLGRVDDDGQAVGGVGQPVARLRHGGHQGGHLGACPRPAQPRQQPRQLQVHLQER